MTEKEILYLSSADVQAVRLGFKELLSTVEDVFKEKCSKRFEMPPKPGIHPVEDSFIHAMPAYVPKLRAAGIKWISGYPQNPSKNLPYITGLTILNNPQTGLPVCIMDASWVTAERTGAVTVLSAKFLSRENPEVIGIVGCGVQGKSHLEALCHAFKSIRKVKAYDISEKKLEQFLEHAKRNCVVEVIKAFSPREAIEDSDIIVTATPILKEPKPVARLSWVKKGALICPIEFDSFWDSETFSQPDRLYTDDVNQFEYYRTLGHFQSVKKVDGELCELVTGAKQGRSEEKERIAVVNLGLALVDMAVSKAIYDKALKTNLGIYLPY
jgi:ornithine cyclodeaminase/alanine dehydrogenase-like protein (mu-crystallin family)